MIGKMKCEKPFNPEKSWGRGCILKAGCAKKYAFQNFFGEWELKTIRRNPDLTGFPKCRPPLGSFKIAKKVQEEPRMYKKV